jgi:phosphoribosyl-ATP pyrophosphohydrolase/phosphoribosyl-AMP cyclohydrolase
LAEKGLKKIAQKVGEEAVETVIAAMEDDTEAFKNEAADLLFHFLVLLQAKNIKLDDVIGVLKNRRR